MANSKNLKPIKKGELTKEEAKKRGANGGKKSAQARKEKKLMQEVAQETLLKLMPGGKPFQECAFERLQESLMNDYIKPTDFVRILEFLRDTAGQKPVDQIKNDVNCTVESGFESVEAFAKHFKEMIGG